MNIQQAMKQAQALQTKMAEMQKQLEQEEVTGKAGGEMVTVTTTCKGEVKSVTIDPSLLVEDEKEMLEDLIAAAINDGVRRIAELNQSKMSGLTDALNLPAGFKMPF